MKKRFLLVLVVHVLGWLVPSNAVAQVFPEELYQFGFINLSPGLVFASGYDSNISREQGGKAGRDTFVVPQIRASADLGKAHFSSSAVAEVAYFSQRLRPGQRIANTVGEFGIQFVDTPIRPSLALAYQDTYANPTGYEIGGRSRHIENSIRAGFDVPVAARYRMGVQAQHMTVSWDADARYLGSQLKETLNRDNDLVELFTTYELTPLTSITTKAEVMRDRFEFSRHRDADSIRVMGGLRFQSPALLEGSALVGFRRFVPRESTAKDVLGVVADMAISYASAGGTTVAVGVYRDIAYSYDPALGHFLLTSLNVSVTKPMPGKWDAGVTGEVLRLDYNAGDSLELLPNAYRYQYGGVLGYRINSLVRVGMIADRYQYATLSFRAYGFLTVGLRRLRQIERKIPI